MQPNPNVVTTRSRFLLAGVLMLGATVAAAPMAVAHHMPVEGADNPPASLPAPEEANPNTGRISLAFGTDWVSDYYYRGILFQPGDNAQQYLEMRIRLLEDLDPLTSLTLAGGNWNDFRSGGHGSTPNGRPTWWFEANLYARLSATWWDVFSTSATYIHYDTPNDSFNKDADVTISLALADSKWLGEFALNPSAAFAFQTEGKFVQSAQTNGVYMALGLAPGYTFLKDSRFPLNVSAPLTFGFSLRNYYNTPNGGDQVFGYFQGGPLLTIPLSFIPRDVGQWSFRAGVQFLALNSNLQTIDDRGGFTPIGSVGFAMTY
ncbi:MAG TPA: hypothetical protein VMW56_00675 [Candidatus Margulisiibacteriota bacterium]|nr:hypothetical protein [Candidatus Margulisiibacteriota bacterium]